MKKNIKVVYKAPNQPYEIRTIPNEYSSYVELINADFIGRTLLPGIDSVDVIADDSFLINEKRNNANFIAPEIETIFCGPVIFMGYDPNTGDNIGLSDSEIDYVCKYIEKHQVHNMTLEEAYNVYQAIYVDAKLDLEEEL